jgi:hypothetical protein
MTNRFDRESSMTYTPSNELYENEILITSDGSNLVLNILRVSFFLKLVIYSSNKSFMMNKIGCKRREINSIIELKALLVLKQRIRNIEFFICKLRF